jgi:D-beta-D-heptose 7-phosphate kinase/D-beta-D-heptose 1-phosphate adenosyltransferase
MSSVTFDVQALRAIVARFAGRRLLVLGDLMLDRYLWGRVDRISPEAPVPVVEIERESFALGGAGNVAANLKALGAEPILIGVVGDDPDGAHLRAAFEQRGIDTRALVVDATRPTTVKTRIIAHSQQVVRADRESRGDLAGSALQQTLEALDREVGGCEGMVVSDYGKGVVNAVTIAKALASARERGIRVSVDPKESHVDAYRGVSILTPNQHEAGVMAGRRIRDDDGLREVGWGLQKRLDAEALLITRGADGMSLFERGGRYTHLPTVAREVFDVTGAGDTVVGVVALALACGADFPSACTLANHAAGLVIREVGTTSVSPLELLTSLDPAP